MKLKLLPALLWVSSGAAIAALVIKQTSTASPTISGDPNVTAFRLVVQPFANNTPTVVTIPSDVKVIQFYDTVTAGDSIFTARSIVHIESSAGDKLIRINGQQLLALGGRVVVPRTATKLWVQNGAPAGSPGTHVTLAYTR